MFCEYYGLREEPFGVTPDPRFLYFSRTHREAFASIAYAIQADRGFVALIARPGMGKTSLLFLLLERLKQVAKTAFLFQTRCRPTEFLQYVLAELGQECHEQNSVILYEELNSCLRREARSGKRVVVIIDEAQNLSDSVLESVRLLSNFETPQSKLLQIILAGQPELGDKLSRPSLSQLSQRISTVSHLECFSPGETSRYIEHRLRVAGRKGSSPLFTGEACSLIADVSGGIPRNINNLCFSALSLGYATSARQIGEDIIRDVAGDLSLAMGSRSYSELYEGGKYSRRESGDSERGEPEPPDETVNSVTEFPDPFSENDAVPLSSGYSDAEPSTQIGSESPAPDNSSGIPYAQPQPFSSSAHSGIGDTAAQRTEYPAERWAEGDRHFSRTAEPVANVPKIPPQARTRRRPSLIARIRRYCLDLVAMAGILALLAFGLTRIVPVKKVTATQVHSTSAKGITLTESAGKAEYVPSDSSVNSTDEREPSRGIKPSNREVTGATRTERTLQSSNGTHSKQPGGQGHADRNQEISVHVVTIPRVREAERGAQEIGADDVVLPASRQLSVKGHQSSEIADIQPPYGNVAGSSVMPVFPGSSSPPVLEAHATAGKDAVGETAEEVPIRTVQPEYPAIAKQAGVEGEIVLDTVVARDGSIRGVRVVAGNPLLARAAVTAVKQWRYRPRMIAGQYVDTHTYIKFIFALEGR